MRLAVISFTQHGSRLNKMVSKAMSLQGYDCDSYAIKKYASSYGLKILDQPLQEWTGEMFEKMDAILFIGATGIAVRSIAPFVQSKTKDPAIVVMDEKGVFLMKGSIEKAAGKNFRFTLTTNGMLIDDDVIDFANREMSNVVLSLDGRKEVHDRFRVDYAGKGSWERIVPKFQKLVSARGGKNYYMRGTFTHANPDFLKDIQQMLDLGFTELSMEPVVCAADDPSALTQEDLPIVLEQYEQLAQLMLQRRKEGRPFTFYHYMIDLKGGPCIYKRISGCGSGTEYMAVTPWGDLYPCHQFVGEEKFKLGNVWDGVTNQACQSEFAACNVYAHPECADCWAKLYCSGGCAANAYHATGSVTGIYEYGCKLFRKRMECAIMVEAVKALEGSK